MKVFAIIIDNFDSGLYKNIVIEGEFIKKENGKIVYNANGTIIYDCTENVFNSREDALKAIKDRNYEIEINQIGHKKKYY